MMGSESSELGNQRGGQPNSGGHLSPSFLICNGGERNVSCADCTEVKRAHAPNTYQHPGVSVYNGLNENVPHGLGSQLVALFWEVQVVLPCWRTSFIEDQL